MIYQHEKKVNFYDLDAKGNVKLTALLKYINIASFDIAEVVGAGMKDTLKYGMVFVLQRFGMKINKLPKMDDILIIKTWPSESTRSAFIRQGEILDTSGNKMLEWESLWVLIDINERKIKRPSALPAEFPQYGNLGVEVRTERIKLPEAGMLVASYTHIVRYSELDVNGHMNNAVYGDLVSNLLNGEELEGGQVVQFNYINEAKLGDELLVEYMLLNSSAQDDGVYIVATCGEKTMFTVSVKKEAFE
jgi:acyl-ACP thioesterase